MQSPHLELLLHQQTLQHPAARKGECRVLFVDPVHQFQIGVRGRAWLVLDTAPADPQQNGLSAYAQLCTVVDHRFALKHE